MDKEVFFPIWLIAIIVVSCIIMALDFFIKFARENRRKEETTDSYVPDFKNESIEKYYYKVYEVVTTNFLAYGERSKMRFYKFLIVFSLVPFAGFNILARVTEIHFFVHFANLSILAAICIAIFVRPKKFNSSVVPKILGFVRDNLEFSSTSGISRAEYTEAYNSNFDRYYSSDLISGTLKGCQFNMAEVKVGRHIIGENENQNYEVVFDGVIAIVDLSGIRKSINTSTNGIYAGKDLIIINNNPLDEYDAKILNNKLYVKFNFQDLFSFNYSNVKKESCYLAESLYNIECIFNSIEQIIDDIIKRGL